MSGFSGPLIPSLILKSPSKIVCRDVQRLQLSTQIRHSQFDKCFSDNNAVLLILSRWQHSPCAKGTAMSLITLMTTHLSSSEGKLTPNFCGFLRAAQSITTGTDFPCWSMPLSLQSGDCS
ncbi:hypothetical protein PoB_005916600 [Plakobranchus ocellatus]|uniref:Uncharacterized protein n=1 Tax=Plakobranchus ocellatus TaxID=259542 RepID=A0AAV4CIG6_9GAST|nr:hypothetical protein PoB_005916600 [Plakobranchus ocellatus]